jgi:predicted nucleic acid-binding protein
MLRIVDASVAVKWFLPEAHKENAERLLREYLSDVAELAAPDLLIAEVGNIFWKRCSKRGDITMTQASESYRHLLSLDIPLHPSSQLASAALQLAITEGRSMYDMLYLALAEQNGCRLITADEKLLNALGKKFPCLQWIGDF